MRSRSYFFQNKNNKRNRMHKIVSYTIFLFFSTGQNYVKFLNQQRNYSKNHLKYYFLKNLR